MIHEKTVDEAEIIENNEKALDIIDIKDDD